MKLRKRRGLILILVMPLLLVGILVAHDTMVCRSEFDPFKAHFKARYSAPECLTGFDQVMIVEEPLSSDDVDELGDGRFEVRMRVRCRQGSSWSSDLPLTCTILCRGLDWWVVESCQLGDSPRIPCGYELQYTGQVNRLWSYRIERALGLHD